EHGEYPAGLLHCQQTWKVETIAQESQRPSLQSLAPRQAVATEPRAAEQRDHGSSSGLRSDCRAVSWAMIQSNSRTHGQNMPYSDFRESNSLLNFWRILSPRTHPWNGPTCKNSLKKSASMRDGSGIIENSGMRVI